MKKLRVRFRGGGGPGGGARSQGQRQGPRRGGWGNGQIVGPDTLDRGGVAGWLWRVGGLFRGVGANQSLSYDLRTVALFGTSDAAGARGGRGQFSGPGPLHSLSPPHLHSGGWWLVSHVRSWCRVRCETQDARCEARRSAEGCQQPKGECDLLTTYKVKVKGARTLGACAREDVPHMQADHMAD